MHVNTDADHFTVEINRVSIYSRNRRKASLPLDVFVGLSSLRGPSLQPKIYNSLYDLNIINLTKEAVHLCDRTGVKSSIISFFTEMVTRCGSFAHYGPHFLHFCDSLTDDRGRESNVSRLIDLHAPEKGGPWTPKSTDPQPCRLTNLSPPFHRLTWVARWSVEAACS